MAIASEIIDKVRQNLVDPDADRWSDDRLLSLLNDALHYVALEGRYNPQRGWIRLNNNQNHYDVSEDAVKLLRFEYDGREIPFRTPEEMDRLFPQGWLDRTGNRPEYIVVGLRAIGHFTVYPLIEEVGLDVQITANSPTGLITSLTFSEDPIEITGTVGDLNVNSILEYLKVTYVENPAEVTSLDQELDAFVDETLATVLPFYITSQAYRDNQDVENIRQAEAYWRDFLERLFNSSITQDGRSSDKIRTTGYNGGIND